MEIIVVISTGIIGAIIGFFLGQFKFFMEEKHRAYRELLPPILKAGYRPKEENEDDFNKALAIDTSLVEAYSNRGWVYYNLEKYSLAMSDLNTAIKLEPASALAYYYRGLLYLSEDRSDFAMADFKKAEELTNDPVLYDKIERSIGTMTGKEHLDASGHYVS